MTLTAKRLINTRKRAIRSIVEQSRLVVELDKLLESGIFDEDLVSYHGKSDDAKRVEFPDLSQKAKK